MNFLTIETLPVTGPVVKDLINGQTYPYSPGDGTTLSADKLALITTRAGAHESARVAQDALLAAMRAGGFLPTDHRALNLDEVRAAYAAYLQA